MTENELRLKRTRKKERRARRKKELAEAIGKMTPEEREIYRIEEEIAHLRVMQIGTVGLNNLITRGEEISNAEDVRRID